MFDYNNHNSQLVREINDIYNDQTKRLKFEKIVETLADRYKEEYWERVCPNDFDLENVKDYITDFLTRVCDDADLQEIIDYCTTTTKTLYCIDVNWIENWYGNSDNPSFGTNIPQCFLSKELADRNLKRTFKQAKEDIKTEVIEKVGLFSEQRLSVVENNDFLLIVYDDIQNVRLEYEFKITRRLLISKT